MSAMKYWVFAICCLLTAYARALPPQQVTVDYDMIYNGTAMAQVVDRLEHDGRAYLLSEEVKGKGFYALIRSGAVRRMARGTVGANGLRPAEFRDRRGDAAESVARFEWGKAVLIQGQDGRGEATPMPSLAPELPLSDRLSFLWSFAFRSIDFIHAGKEIRALLSDGKGLSAFRYLVAGTETLKTSAGALETVRLVKQRDPGDDRGTEIWLATERHYLPVRILVIEKDGTRIDQIVTRIGA